MLKLRNVLLASVLFLGCANCALANWTFNGASLNTWTPGPPTIPAYYSLLPSNEDPAGPNADGASVNLGVEVEAANSGTISGIRFYKSPGDTATSHVVTLYTASGTSLATATSSSETSSGWQYVYFTSPVSVSANTYYVASVFETGGYYEATSGYFASTVTNGPLTALSGSNGLYLYGSSPAFPTATYGSTNYWVDILFSQTEPPPESPNNSVIPPLTSVVDTGGNTWTTSGGIVYQNGVPTGAPTGIVGLMLVSNIIWSYDGTDYYSWNGANWSGGTATSPLPISYGSLNYTAIPSASSFKDAQGNTWTLAGGIPYENGTEAGTFTGATELAWVNGVVWLSNGPGAWWSWGDGGGYGNTGNWGNKSTLNPLTLPAPNSSPAATPDPDPSNGTAPAIASAVGYNTKTFSTSSFTTSNTDMTSTFASGYQWYKFNFYSDWSAGAVVSLGNPYYGGPGSMTVGGGVNTFNDTIASAAVNGAYTGGFVGTAFGGGAYIEAVVAFNAQTYPAGTSDGWPSFWTNPLEGNLGTASEYVESDIMEYYQGQYSDPLDAYSITLHDWDSSLSGGQTATGIQPSITRSNFGNFHTYGELWVPATPTSSGYVKFYFDGTLEFTTTYSYGGAPGTFAAIDQGHHVIQFGSNSLFPITVQSVTVWQANGSSNLHN